MAFADTQTVSIAANSVLHTLARPFVAFGNMMIGLAEASSQAQELNHLADLSDAYRGQIGLPAAKWDTRRWQDMNVNRP